MIPASYLFKDIYRQHWEEPAPPVMVAQPHRPTGGLLRSLIAAAAALFRRPSRSHDRHFGSHAFE